MKFTAINLLLFDAFEQSLKVTLSETVVTFAFDELEKDRSNYRL